MEILEYNSAVSKTSKHYLVRDKSNRYQQAEAPEAPKSKYYNDCSKSLNRKALRQKIIDGFTQTQNANIEKSK